jgi:G:T/U-mismatch repair DNA glycosylase
MYSKHPFEPYIPNNATKLIIGTIPPARFCFNENSTKGKLLDKDVDFYYGSRDNKFWQIVEQVFNLNFSEGADGIEQRKAFLKVQKIGITDVINICEREKESALDTKLNITELKDISRLLIENPTIDTLIYTSEFVKSQVNKISKSYHTIDLIDKKKQTTIIGNKKYDVWILYSPSPTALRNMGLMGNEKRLEQYRKVFGS